MNWYKESKKKEDDFNYGGSIRDLWRNIILREQDRVGIHFDLENDDGDTIRTKDLKYKDKTGDIFRVKAKMCWAAGDWESQICYFRCQIQDRTYFEKRNEWSNWSDDIKCIIIPEKSNPNLTKCESGLCAKDGEKAAKDINEKALWDEMVKLAEKRVKQHYDEYKKDDGEMDLSFENTGSVNNLTDLMTSKK